MRVVHVFRSPVGGLFRHVCDLVEAQNNAGMQIGIICDTLAGGDYSNRLIASLEERCSLGVHRFAMPRMPSLADFSNTRRATDLVRQMNPDILHGHGSKGGLYARLAGRRIGKPSIYTPHGGVLNYHWASLSGPLFLGSEMILARIGSGFAFVCEYERETFNHKIGILGRPYIVVHNGLWPREFQPVAPNADATDLLFAGEMRYNKGVDLLLEAMVILNRDRRVTLTLAGDGVQFEEYKALAKTLGTDEYVQFVGRMPIQQAFAKGRIFVSPSRFESFPYVIMEAIAADLPIVSTDVGGIAEVLPKSMLTSAVDAPAIANKINEFLSNEPAAKAAARSLSERVKLTTTANDMAKKIIGLYETLLSQKAAKS